METKDEKPMMAAEIFNKVCGMSVDSETVTVQTSWDNIEKAMEEYAAQELAKVRAEYSERSLNEEKVMDVLNKNINCLNLSNCECMDECKVKAIAAKAICNLVVQNDVDKALRDEIQRLNKVEQQLKEMMLQWQIKAGESTLVVPQESKPITKEEVKKIWEEFYSEIDGLARDVDSYDFGLPMAWENYDNLIIKSLSEKYQLTKK